MLVTMDRQDLDDTYDLLSPVRRSNNSYSNSFESEEEETTRNSFTSPDFKSSSFSSSPKIPHPKYSSTARYTNYSKPPPQHRKSPAPSRKQVVRHTSPSKARSSHDSTKDLIKIPQEGDAADLSVWEEWLLRKLQEDRDKIKLKKLSEKQEKEEQERVEREKEQKKRQEELNYKQWCEEKMLKQKLQRTMKRREEILKKELKAQEEEEIKRKAKVAYEKWLEKQSREEEEKKRKEEERKLKEMKEKEEKKRRNEECFQEWLKKANERNPPSPRVKSGPSVYPAPTYRNPAPWVGPMSDKATRESVLRQHKEMIAQKQEGIRRSRMRPQTVGKTRQDIGRQKKGLVTTGPEKGKGVLICRPASAAPIFYNVPNRKNGKFSSDMQRPSKGRS